VVENQLRLARFFGSQSRRGSNTVDRLLLQCDNLFVERGTRNIIAGLSFEVRSGEALLLMGPNGAGKTTLIRTLAGFIAPASGTLRLDGGGDDRELFERCHYVGHLSGIKASLTAAQNLTFWARYLGDTADRGAIAERADASLSELGLAPLSDFPAGLLSAGQKRRLGLARLRVAARPIWLLDEPTASLDSASAELLSRLIQEHLGSGGLVVAATHLPLGLENARYLRLAPGRTAVSLSGDEAQP